MNDETTKQIENLSKLKRGVFIPNPLPTDEDYYEPIPQEGEPTEHDTGEKYCEGCKKVVEFMNIWIKDPIQPEDMGEKGKKVEPYWIEVCKPHKHPTGGLTIMECD